MSDLRRKRRRVEIEDDKELENQLNSTITNEYSRLEQEVEELNVNPAALSKRKKERKKRLENQIKKIKMIQKTREAMGETVPSLESIKPVNLNDVKPIAFQANQTNNEIKNNLGLMISNTLSNDHSSEVKMEDDESTTTTTYKKTGFSLVDLQNQLNEELQTLATQQVKQRRFTQRVDFKKALALQEVEQVKNIFAMNEFKQDPFGALKQHLQNKISQEKASPFSTLAIPENYSSKKRRRVRTKRNSHGSRSSHSNNKVKDEDFMDISGYSGSKRKRED